MEQCPTLLPFNINNEDPVVGIFAMDTFEIVTMLNEKHFERMLTCDATLAYTDVETAFPFDNFRINVVSEYQTVAAQAEFSRETRAVRPNAPNPVPSTVRLSAPELGAFLIAAKLVS